VPSDENRPTDGKPARSAGEDQPANEPDNVPGVPVAPTQAASEPAPKRRPLWRILLPAVIVLDILAFLFVPPYPKDQPGQPVGGIGDLILANLESLTPHIVWPEGKAAPTAIVSFDPSLTNTIVTSWLVIAFLLIVALLARRGMKLVPGLLQNAVEYAWESLENWAVSLGGEAARRHIPLFIAFFLFILISNWSGLLPFFGKFEVLRAPTSDVNVTIGLALVVFLYFQFQGFRALGVRRYLGKFFPLGAFRNGIGAGLIALYVGLIEFLLEFIKPVTLAMRLFGNIFGGEVALGVITALTVALVPALFLGLEALLNFVQALIFSTLMLIYTVIAVEIHEDEEHIGAGEATIPEGNISPPIPRAQPAH
jgi:F-type H+-transporting ATPase subunit a